jgi:hypothetical protein
MLLAAHRAGTVALVKPGIKISCPVKCSPETITKTTVQVWFVVKMSVEFVVVVILYISFINLEFSPTLLTPSFSAFVATSRQVLSGGDDKGGSTSGTSSSGQSANERYGSGQWLPEKG